MNDKKNWNKLIGTAVELEPLQNRKAMKYLKGKRLHDYEARILAQIHDHIQFRENKKFKT